MCVYGEWVRRSSQVHQHLLRSRDMERLWSTPVTARGKVLLGKSQDNLPQPNIHRQIPQEAGQGGTYVLVPRQHRVPQTSSGSEFFQFWLVWIYPVTSWTPVKFNSHHALHTKFPRFDTWQESMKDLWNQIKIFIYLFLIKRETMVASCIRLFAKEYCEHPAQFYTLTIENNR